MRSLSEIVGEAKSMNAVAKLVRIPCHEFAKPVANSLHEKLLEKATDLHYGNFFAHVRDQKGKYSLLNQYANDPNSYISKSEWFKKAIIGLVVEDGRIDRRKKSADPVKTAIAGIKARHPKYRHSQICAKLDGMDIELPERWQRSSERSWTYAFKNPQVRPLMKSFISKVKA